MGAVTGAVVGQRCRVGSQLDGRDHRVALTDGGLHIQRCRIVGVALVVRRPTASLTSTPVPLAKTQLVGIGIVHIAGQAAANIIEEDVAAPLDGRDHIDVAAVAMAGTAGVVILEVVVHAVAVNGRILVDEPLSSAATATAGLKVEPGVYRPCNARLNSGRLGSELYSL